MTLVAVFRQIDLFVHHAFPLAHRRRDGRVARHVRERAHHVEQAVERVDEADDQDRLLFGDADLGEGGGREEQARARDTRCADGDEGCHDRDQDVLADRNIEVQGLGSEEGHEPDVDRRAIHVDGGTEGENRRRDRLVDAQVLVDAGDCDGERRAARGCGVGDCLGVTDTAVERLERQAQEHLDDAAVGQRDVDDAREVEGQGQETEALEDPKSLVGHDDCHEGEHTEGGGLHHDHGHLHDRFGGAVEETADLFACVSGEQDADAEEDREEDDLEDVPRGQGVKRIRRDDL